MKYALKTHPGRSVKLDKIDTADTRGLALEDSQDILKDFDSIISEKQALLYGAATQSILVVLQGMDTSGKDGTIKHVFSSLNPLGCIATAFKVPTHAEAAHDFLWRVHKYVPAKGQISIFNRSHYEDVIVPSAHRLLSAKEIEKRMQHINNFEKLLCDSGTIVLKFFLHISKGEQKERLLAREKNPDTAWKLNISDWSDRKMWSRYHSAYEEVLEKTSTEHAPWHIVPADKKWFRNVVVSEVFANTLVKASPDWEEVLKKMSKKNIRELQEYRLKEARD